MTDTLTPQRFDAAVSKKTTSPLIWTAKAIGEKINRSEGYVRKVLANAEGTPIRQSPSGRIYVDEGELLEYFRDRAA